MRRNLWAISMNHVPEFVYEYAELYFDCSDILNLLHSFQKELFFK